MLALITMVITTELTDPMLAFAIFRLDIENIVMGVMKMAKTVPRVRLEPVSLASVLPFHHVGFPDVTTIPTPTCVCISFPQRSVQTTTLIPLEL